MDYFSNERLREGLRRKTIRGGVFTVLAQVVQLAVSFAVVPLLARLLDRADFGVAVKVTAITGFATLLVDAGLSFATVQSATLNHRQASNLFWVSALLGLTLGGLVVGAGPLIALFYDDPRLTSACVLIGCAYPITGLAMQHQALLNRALQYDLLAVVRVSSLVIGNVACVALAWRWQSYWALLWRPVIEAAVRAAVVWTVCPWRPGRPTRGAGIRELLGFGTGVTGASLVSYVSSQVDNILLGRYWSDELLGLYERSMRCLMVPLQQAQGPIQSLVTPVLSRLSDEPERQRGAYLAVVARMLCIAGPVVAFLANHPSDFVVTVLGPDYEDAAPIFAWLTLAGLVQPIVMALRWLLLYQGRGTELVRMALVNGFFAIATIVAGLPWGPVGVAASLVLGGVFLRLPASLFLACRNGPVSVSDFLKAGAACLPQTLAVAGVNLLLMQLVEFSAPWCSLAAGVAVSLLAWLAALPWSPMRPMLAAFFAQRVGTDRNR